MDSHKLMFHPHRVARWLEEGDVYPLYMEISPSGACNHRCSFCALDYRGYEPRFLDTPLIMERLTELGGLGVKSIMYGGEGEPLLHRDIAEIVNHTKRAGIDVALTTNGTLLDADLAERVADSLSWVRVSLNAAAPETYGALHRTSPDDFGRVLGNISAVAAVVRRRGASCTVGVQMLLLPENAAEAEPLAAMVRDAGADYLAVKPYSQHHKSITRRYEQFDYTPYIHLGERLERYSTDGFRVICRAGAMGKMHRGDRGYGQCLALPFWSYIDSAGTVWGCSSHLGDERFRYGSIADSTFRDIWQGERRRRSMATVADGLDFAGCRAGCRMDEVNRYLWELAHPAPHVNFI